MDSKKRQGCSEAHAHGQSSMLDKGRHASERERLASGTKQRRAGETNELLSASCAQRCTKEQRKTRPTVLGIYRQARRR